MELFERYQTSEQGLVQNGCEHRIKRKVFPLSTFPFYSYFYFSGKGSLTVISDGAMSS